jgi:hypothetical protein
MVVEGIVFAVKGIILTECLTRAARSWGIFDSLRSIVVRINFIRKLLDCFECTSVWVGAFVVLYIQFCEIPFLTYLLVFSSIARWLNVFYEYLDACRAAREGEI